MLAPRALKRKAAALTDDAVAVAGTSVAHDSLPDDIASDTEISDAEEVQPAGFRPIPGANLPASVPVTASADITATASVVAPDDNASAVQVVNGDQAKPSDSAQSPDNAADAARLAAVLEALEESLSDWGLSCQNRHLLEKIEASENGYIHVSQLLSLPAIAQLTENMTDIAQAIRNGPSDRLQLDDTGFQVRRKDEMDIARLRSWTSKDWADATFYAENIPHALPGSATKHAAAPVSPIRACLESILGTIVDVVRLPPVYVPPTEAKERMKSRQSSKTDHVATQYSLIYGTKRSAHGMDSMKTDSTGGLEGETAAQTKKRQKAYVLPNGGGPFKGYAFFVIRDPSKAAEALQAWNVDTIQQRSTADIEEDDKDVDSKETPDAESGPPSGDAGADDANHTPKKALENGLVEHAPEHIAAQTPDDTEKSRKAALRRGFSLMPITTFNVLKSEYMTYYRDLILVKEQSDERGSGRRQRSPSPHSQWSDKRRAPSPDRWERKARSPTPEARQRKRIPTDGRWERKAPSPSPERPNRVFDAKVDTFPRGCVVFMRNFNPTVNDRTLKGLLHAILEQEEVGTYNLQYVDHMRNVDSCHLRFADTSTANLIASYFSGKRKFKHANPHSTDPDTALAISGEGDRPIETEVLNGTVESIYWARVPMSAREAYAN